MADQPNTRTSSESTVDDIERNHAGVAPVTADKEAAACNEAESPAPEEPEAQRTRSQNFLIVFALCLALFLPALDITIITTAIPTISAHFNSSVGYVWVGSAYLLGNAAVAPMWGKISDIFGRKPVLLTAVGIFWVGSLLCGVSTSMGMLIAARAIQGIGGGGTMILPNICVSDLFSMRNRGMYFGIFGMVWAVASALGPVLGGVFTDKVSWRWCFYINLPLSGVGMIILIFVLKLHNPRTRVKEGLKAIDWSGSLLCVGGTLMFLMGLEFGGVTHPWASAPVLCLMIFGIITIGLFVVNEWKVAEYPVTPLRLFKHRTSIASYSLAFFHALTVMAGSYWLPLYFQGVLGTTALMSGVYLLPYIVSLSIISAIAGILIKKTGKYKILISTGTAIATLGFGLFTDLGPKQDWVKLAIFQVVAGIGIGPNFQAPLIALQTNIEPSDIGSATSTFSFLRQLGTSVSVVVGGAIFNNEMQKQQSYLQREMSSSQLANRLSGSNAAGSVQLVAHLTGHDGEVARIAYWNALKTMYIVYTVFAGVGLIISLFIKQVNLSKVHTEHKTGLKTLKGRTENEEDSK